MTSVSQFLPLTAAFADKVQKTMDVILHIGAQRTATTSFQAYLRANSAELNAQGIGYWGPHRTRRGGVFTALTSIQDGVVPDGVVNRAVGETREKIAKHISFLQKRGTTHLIVSDENMLGTVRTNVRADCFYPYAAQRLDRFARVFEGIVTRIAISIRSFETYWPSALAFSVGRSGRMPRARALERIVTQPRGWSDVVSDVATTFPGVDILVDSHESYANRPELRLSHLLDGAIDPPLKHSRLWLNPSPDLAQLRASLTKHGRSVDMLPAGEGRWDPFNPEQSAKLREKYADDLFWLYAGADGLARFIEEKKPDQTGKNLSGGATTRGQDYDREDRRMARTG